jgi:hypothetical protein
VNDLEAKRNQISVVSASIEPAAHSPLNPAIIIQIAGASLLIALM